MERERRIHSVEALGPEDISLDRYLPWSFVAHDRPWNPVPVSKAVDSAIQGEDASLDVACLFEKYETAVILLESIAERQGFAGGWRYGAVK